MTEIGKGQCRKKTAIFLPPKLFGLAQQLAKYRLTSVSYIVRELLYDAVFKAVATGELLDIQSQADNIKGGSTGQGKGVDEMLEKLEKGELSITDPQVQAWLEQNGYTLEPQAG